MEQLERSNHLELDEGAKLLPLPEDLAPRHLSGLEVKVTSYVLTRLCKEVEEDISILTKGLQVKKNCLI